jgi:hypothetical protein
VGSGSFWQCPLSPIDDRSRAEHVSIVTYQPDEMGFGSGVA